MLITNDYLAEQKRLHLNPNYGVASLSFAPIVKQIIKQYAPTSLTDYGAGKCNLQKALGEVKNYQPYDPAFPEYGPARPAELVCCIDVLEHIEPECLDDVLDDLKRITMGLGFFSIHTGPAAKTLSDGRNAHIIQESAKWWLPRLCERFQIHQLQEHSYCGKGFWVIASVPVEFSPDSVQLAA